MTVLPLARYPSARVNPGILAQPIRFPTATELCAPTRFMKSAMSEELATWHPSDPTRRGLPEQRLKTLYKRFSGGGFGIVITGGIMVTSLDLDQPGRVTISRDADSALRRTAFAKWTKTTKKSGALFLAQLNHAGSVAALTIQPNRQEANRMTVEAIQTTIDSFVYAAEYAYQAGKFKFKKTKKNYFIFFGFNGIELNGANIFLPGSFLNANINKRTDAYGGPLENRARFLFETYEKISAKVDRKKFIIGLKISSLNLVTAFDQSEFEQFGKKIQDLGFDYVSLSGGRYAELKHTENKCFFKNFIETIKTNCDKTVIFLNGGFLTAEDMHDAISKNWTDGICIARGAAAEPDLPNKIMSGFANAAVQSLIDPADYPTTQQAAGTQLWQCGSGLRIFDASDPDQIREFKRELADHRAIVQQRFDAGKGKVVGFAKFRCTSNK